MPLDTKNYNKLDIEKIAFPFTQQWVFFLQAHQNSPNTRKSAKAIFRLLESVLCYSNIALIANYLAYPRYQKKDKHSKLYQYITQKKNWTKNAIVCLKELWPQENTFLHFKGLNKNQIIQAFENVLFSDYKKSKKPTTREYSQFLENLNKIIPIISIWNNYTLTYYQDYPWQHDAEITVPTLSFTGLTPVSSLQSIKTNIYGTLGQFYLFDESNTNSLSLYPFIFSENPEKEIFLFFNFQMASGKIEYFDWEKNNKISADAKQEIKNICMFLKSSFDYAAVDLVINKNLNYEELYLPVEKIDVYAKISSSVRKVLSKKQFNLLTSLRELLVKFFVNSLTDKLKEPEIIKTITAIGLGEKSIWLGDRDGEPIEKDILFALEDISSDDIMTNSLFDFLWQELKKKKDYNNSVLLLKIWSFHDIHKVKKHFLLLSDEHKDDAFSIILNFLFAQEMYKEIILFFEFVHEEEKTTYAMNRELICSLVKTFIREKPEKCFYICEKFSQSWSFDWIDGVLSELIKLSLADTIKLISTCGYSDEKSYDNQKWQRWLQLYNILVHDDEKLFFVAQQIKDPISQIRIHGIVALKQHDIELFMKIVSDISFSNNFEHIICSLCFFVNHLRTHSPQDYDIIAKLTDTIDAYAHSILDIIGSYHIKKDCDKFIGSMHCGNIMKMHKEILLSGKELSIFETFISYLATHNVINLDEIKKNRKFIEEKNLAFYSDSKNEKDIPSELVDFYEKSPEHAKNDYNTVNELLAEIASLSWEKNKGLAIHYILQIIPETFFDKEDAVKKILEKNKGISFKELELFQLERYELDRIQTFWLENHIQQFPQNIIPLYSKVEESMKRKLVELGMNLLITFNLDEAVKFLEMVKSDMTFDFGEHTGKIFLDFYRHDVDSGKTFLQKINVWDLAHNSEVAISLLKSFKKLPFKKLFDMYRKLIEDSSNLYREELCTLLLSAIVGRKPSLSFSLLKNLIQHFSERTIEKIVYSLIYQLSKSNLELGKNLFYHLYKEIQVKEFTIDDDSLIQIENSIVDCIKEKTFCYFLPEIYVHKWIVVPRLFVKICYELLSYNPDQAIRLLSHMVGKKEMFLLLGEPSVQISSEKDFDFILQFETEPKIALKHVHKKAILDLFIKSISRFSEETIENIFPYILHPMWSRINICKIKNAFPKDIEKSLSLTNYLIFVVLQEMDGFQRSRFESNFKCFIEKFYKNETEKMDLEKHFFPIFFRIMFFFDKNFIDQVWNSYWDQVDFISVIFVNALESPKQQIEWIGKILNNEDKVDALETIAVNIIDEGFPDVVGFVEESAQTIDINGGLEYLFLRIPNIFIVLLETDIEMVISLINRIFDEEVQSSAVEFALEYLSTTKTFSKQMCKRIMPWLCYTNVSSNIDANDLLYFYCQLAERMWEIDCEEEAKKVTNEIIKLAKKCEEREKKYYLEDLITIIISRDISLAHQVVLSYKDNNVSFLEVVLAQSLFDIKKAIKMVRKHQSKEFICSALIEMACFHAEKSAKESFNILVLPEIKDLNTDSIWNAHAIVAVRKKSSPQQYINKIVDYNELLKTYCDVLEIYLEQKKSHEVSMYRQKIKDMITNIQPSYNFLGLSLEWGAGFPIEINNNVLRKISLLHPECALKLFDLYCEYDRFADLDDVLQVIFRGVVKQYPEKIIKLLGKINYFDLSYFQDILKEEIHKNPQRVMSWLIQQEQSNLYSLVLDEITDDTIFSACLKMALESNKSFSKEEYIEKLSILIKYIFRLGGPFILFQIMDVLRAFSPPPYAVSLGELLDKCAHISGKWEEKEKEKLKIRE